MNLIKKLISLSAIVIMAFVASHANAGAGANVYICVNLTAKPLSPYTVKATVGGSGVHCMNDTGSNKTFTASSVGLNCGSVGYVESKASSTKGDLCATDKSKWPAGYTISNTAFSGSVVTQWSVGNSISIDGGGTKNTVVCNSKTLCDSTSASWDKGTQGPIYLIFQPDAAK